jgi:hypothetical protein
MNDISSRAFVVVIIFAVAMYLVGYATGAGW